MHYNIYQLAKRTFRSRYDHTPVTSVTEQSKRPMDAVASNNNTMRYNHYFISFSNVQTSMILK